MPEEQTPLYVRLSADPNRRLERAVTVSGKSKRQLVDEAVGAHFTDDGLVVGNITMREEIPQVLTLAEAAALLRVEPSALERAALGGEVPGRQIAGAWRFSKAALIAWLGMRAEAQET
jgi:hypothetical protein